jgi:hypothetical protein
MTPPTEGAGKPGGEEAGKPSSPVQETAPKETKSDPIPETPPADSKPGSKPDAQPQEEAGQRPGAKIHVEAENLHTDNFKVVGNDYRTIYNYESGAGPRLDVFEFDWAHELPISQEETDAKNHILEDRVKEQMLERLQARRILCIYGERSVGKDSTAKFLAHLLRTRDSAIDKPALLIQPLESRVQISLRKIAQDEKYRGRPVVFGNALDRDNREIRTFLGTVDGAVASALSAQLREMGSFIVFTATDRTISDEIPNLESVGIGALLAPPDASLLRAALERALTDSKIATVPTDDDMKHVATHGRTVSRVFYCVKKNAEALRGGLSIAEAFSQIDDIENWFLRELPKDFSAWRFAFCLALAQPLRSAPGVPWADFNQLVAALTPSIQSIVGKDDALKSYARQRTSEDSLLQEVRAVTDRDPVEANDVIRFQDSTYVDRIWATMLRHNRVILSGCVLPLEKCSEQSGITMLAARTLRIIGRIGEIDPGSYLAPLVERWTAEESFAGAAKVGLLFEGAFAAENALYTKVCERWLYRLAKSDEKGHVLAAVAICKQIGPSRIPIALRVLRQIAEERLSKPLENTQEIEKWLLRIEHEHSKQQHTGVTMLLELCHEWLAEVSRRMYAEQIPLIVSIQFALTSLLLEADPTRVIKELHQWGVQGGTASALFSLLYLAKDGIADALAAAGSEDVEFLDESVILHPVLNAMLVKKHGITDVGNFLEDVYAGFQRFFPPVSARFFRKAYFAHLTGLMKTVIRAGSGTDELRAVVVRLLRSMNGDLRSSCHEFLTGEEIRREESLAEFVQSVLKAALAPRIAPPSPFAHVRA